MNSRHELIAPHNPDPIIVTRSLIKRAWSDFEPKVVSGLMSGTVAAGILEALAAYGIHTPGAIVAGLPVACYFLASYLTPSVGTVTTVRTGSGLIVEKHSGAVEIKTGAIPIPGYTQQSEVPRGTGGYPPSQLPQPAPEPPADPEPYETPDQTNFTQVLQPEDNRASSILSRLPSANRWEDNH
jgi:hypothetical protein